STVRLWTSNDAGRVAEFVHSSPVAALAFSPDGEMLATGTTGGRIRVWSVSQANPITELECGKEVRAVSLASATGPLVAVCGEIHIWQPGKEWSDARLRRIQIRGLPVVPP